MNPRHLSAVVRLGVCSWIAPALVMFRHDWFGEGAEYVVLLVPCVNLLAGLIVDWWGWRHAIVYAGVATVPFAALAIANVSWCGPLAVQCFAVALASWAGGRLLTRVFRYFRNLGWI